MSDLSAHDPTGRFSSLAGQYAAHRPDYPASAVERILACCPPGESCLVVDVGCGTGISTRQLAGRGASVLGIEPNDAMRQQAEQASGPPGVRYQKGTAEATGLPDGVAHLVVAAQAFHWFDAPRALAEFHRILVPGGWVALMGNERDERDPFTREYGDAIRLSPDSPLVEPARQRAGQALLVSPLFERGEQVELTHSQEMDEAGVLGRAFSASYVPQEGPVAEAVAARLREAFAKYQSEGRVVLRYVTTVYLGRKG